MITPSWLGWLFGARTLAIDLERRKDIIGNWCAWYTPASGRNLDALNDHREIRDALDFREVGSEPRRDRTLIGGVLAP